MSEIDLNDSGYRYSISDGLKHFYEYATLVDDINGLFADSDGDVQIFRKHYTLNNGEPELITVTPLMHMKQMGVIIDAQNDEFGELTVENEDLKSEVESKEREIAELEGKPDKDLAKDMFEKNQLFGWSAKEILNQVFRDQLFFGEIK